MVALSSKPLCPTPDCGRKIESRGYCNACYRRLRRSGSIEKRAVATGCSVEGCPRSHKARGLCKAHYSALLRSEAEGCRVEGCAGVVILRSLCTAHYREWKWEQGSRCSVEGCSEPRYARSLCRRHSRHERNGAVLQVCAPCARCGGPIDLLERTSSGRRRYSSTRTCADCRGWRKSSQVSMTVSELVARDGDACSLCGDVLDLSIRWPAPLAPTVDHIIPGSLGGSGEAHNLAAAHFRCNSTKQARTGWTPAA